MFVPVSLKSCNDNRKICSWTRILKEFPVKSLGINLANTKSPQKNDLNCWPGNHNRHEARRHAAVHMPAQKMQNTVVNWTNNVLHDIFVVMCFRTTGGAPIFMTYEV